MGTDSRCRMVVGVYGRPRVSDRVCSVEFNIFVSGIHTAYTSQFLSELEWSSSKTTGMAMIVF